MTSIARGKEEERSANQSTLSVIFEILEKPRVKSELIIKAFNSEGNGPDPLS